MKLKNRWKRLLCSAILWLGLGTAMMGQSVELLTEANQAYNGKNWEAAKRSFEEIVKQNPHNGQYWFRLGSSHYELNAYTESIGAYLQAFSVGFQSSTTAYNIACGYALLKKKSEALDWLKKAIALGLRNRERLLATDTDLDYLRASNEFKQLLPPVLSDGVARLKGWQADIDYFKRQFEMTHYRLFDHFPKNDWEAAFKRLKHCLPKWEDHQVIVELMRIAATTKAGHSYVVPPFQGDHHFHQLPIELFAFDEGVFVRKAKKEQSALLGIKLVAIGGKPIETVLDSVRQVANPENRVMNDATSLFYLTLPEVLHHFGFSDSVQEVELEFEKSDGSRFNNTLKADLLSLEILSSNAAPSGWVSLNEVSENEFPLYLKNVGNTFWMQFLEEEGVLYCQLNAIRNSNEQSMAAFGKAIADMAQSKEAKAVVLDIRLNNGGNGLLNRDFLLNISKADFVKQRGKFFTIIGRKTFSAATLLVTQLDQFTETIFIGEATGGKPSHVGDDNQFLLPYSGLMASAAMTFWQSPVPYDSREWIAPEIAVPVSLDHYKNNEDAVMNTVLEMVRKFNGGR